MGGNDYYTYSSYVISKIQFCISRDNLLSINKLFNELRMFYASVKCTTKIVFLFQVYKEC